MSNTYFQFKQFLVQQDQCAMKVTTDSCLFGAWVAELESKKPSGVHRVLDIGGGSALLSLLYAQKNPADKIDVIEIDPAAAEQAGQNLSASPWKDRLRVIQDDVRKFFPSGKYDLIISNPPFYENEILSKKETKNTAHHSDQLSLRELLNAIQNLLAPEGRFYLLLPYKRSKEINRLFKEKDLHIDKMILVKQTVNHFYFRIMLQGSLYSRLAKETKLEEISIWNEQKEYTHEFIRLLKEYYLHL